MTNQRGLSYDVLLTLPTALQQSGASTELLQAIIDDEAVAKAAVDGATAHLQLRHWEDESAQRREFLTVKLRDEELFPRRIRNLLLRRHLDTVGDVCMTTATQLEQFKGFGKKSISDIAGVLKVHGLSLRDEFKQPLHHATQLYGGAQYVPARMMWLWISGLDNTSRDILESYDTLADLTKLSALQFIDAHANVHSDVLAVRKNQMLKVRAGLKEAGLSFNDA